MSADLQKPVAVIKVGGDMLSTFDDRKRFGLNIKALMAAGWQCLVLHGGGPQVNALQVVHGLVPYKVAGRRITSAEDLTVIKQALCGEVNVDLVAALVAAGVPALGCHGASAKLIQAQKRPPIKVSAGGDQLIDFGEVGDVTGINVPVINSFFDNQLVPVIASLGVDDAGRIFNINADTTVSAIAKALSADLLILSTAVGGIFRDIKDPATCIAELTPASASQLINEGIISDGMIPKVEEALGLLSQGVGQIAIANASHPDSFLNIATNTAAKQGSLGTRIIAA